VKEQIEEETLAMNVKDKLKISGGDQASDESLLTLDKTLAEIPNKAKLVQNASGLSGFESFTSPTSGE